MPFIAVKISENLRLIFSFSQTHTPLYKKIKGIHSLLKKKSINNFITIVWGICVLDQRLAICCLEEMHLHLFSSDEQNGKEENKEERSFPRRVV